MGEAVGAGVGVNTGVGLDWGGGLGCVVGLGLEGVGVGLRLGRTVGSGTAGVAVGDEPELGRVRGVCGWLGSSEMGTPQETSNRLRAKRRFTGTDPTGRVLLFYDHVPERQLFRIQVVKTRSG